MRFEGLRAGADDYLVKPFAAGELRARVDAHLKLAMARRLASEREAALRAEAEAARDQVISVIESTTDGFMALDQDWRITYVNAEAERLSRMGRAEMQGKNYWELFPGCGRHNNSPRVSACGVGTCSRRIRKLLCPLAPVVHVKAIRLPKAAFPVFYEDVTERKGAEEALLGKQERFRAIFETTPECVKVVAPDGTLLQMNSAGLGMVGANHLDAVLGTNIYDLIAPEFRQAFIRFNESICGGDKGSMEFDIVDLKGQRRNMETYAAPLRQPDGTIVQLGITHDVTVRRSREQAALLLGAIIDSSDDAIISKD